MKLPILSVLVMLLLHHPKGVGSYSFPGLCPNNISEPDSPPIPIKNYKIISEVHLNDQFPSYLFSRGDKRDSLFINTMVEYLRIIYKPQAVTCPQTKLNITQTVNGGWLGASQPHNCSRVEELLRIVFWKTDKCLAGIIWTCKESFVPGKHEKGGLALMGCDYPFERNTNNAKAFLIQKTREYLGPSFAHQVEINWKSYEEVSTPYPKTENGSCPILEACKVRSSEMAAKNVPKRFIAFGMVFLIIVLVLGNGVRIWVIKKMRVGPESQPNVP